MRVRVQLVVLLSILAFLILIAMYLDTQNPPHPHGVTETLIVFALVVVGISYAVIKASRAVSTRIKHDDQSAEGEGSNDISR
jgi:MFS-type transporter involved in bile tolerance (Atg22 family)